MRTTSIGPSLVSIYLFWLGISILPVWRPTIGENLLLGWAYLLLGILTLGTAVAVWRRRPFAPKLYAAWLAAWLLMNGAVDLSSGAPVLHVALWMALVFALLAPVGLYLRSDRDRFEPRTA